MCVVKWIASYSSFYLVVKSRLHATIMTMGKFPANLRPVTERMLTFFQIFFGGHATVRNDTGCPGDLGAQVAMALLC